MALPRYHHGVALRPCRFIRAGCWGLFALFFAPIAAAADLGTLDIRVLPVHVVDLNPRYTGTVDHGALSAEQLVALSEERVGTIADGVSRVLIRAQLPETGSLNCRLPGGSEDGRCEPLRTGTVRGQAWGFVTYTPPDEFGDDGKAVDHRNAVEVRPVEIEIGYSPGGGKQLTVPVSLKLARPPVVLVHGTYDNPDNAWLTPLGAAAPRPVQQDSWLTGSSNRGSLLNTPGEWTDPLYSILRRAGFHVTAVDYRDSNGQSRGSEIFDAPTQGGSRFEDNRHVVWDDAGHSPSNQSHGIKEALRFFREDLQLAATQADVVGHSMGGVLPRVYASDNYNPNRYRRTENFNEGDIHRLITLCSTHHGSDLPKVLEVFYGGSFGEFDSLHDYALAKNVSLLAEWGVGVSTGASVDQVPESPALKRIGKTRIPSHAVACIAQQADLEADEKYFLGYTAITSLFFYAPKMASAALEKFGQPEDAKRLLEQVDRIDWTAWITQGRVNPRDFTAMKVLSQLGRAALFGNTRNDGVVRLQSQRGSLPSNYVTELNGVVHSQATKLPIVKQKVVALLEGPHSAFAPNGFPAAGQAMLNKLPGINEQSVEEKQQAIRESNIVYEQAIALSGVAKRLNKIIIIRPVNEHAKPLIEKGAATKHMTVKGKSADWGPQKGYLPADQAYSKLAGNLDKVPSYNCEVVATLAGDDAVLKHLYLGDGDGRRYAFRKQELSSGPEPDDYGCQKNAKGEYEPTPAYIADLRKRLGDKGQPPVEMLAQSEAPPGYQPFYVLGSINNGKFMTADYDFLAIGTQNQAEAAEQPGWDTKRGGITSWQIKVINAINAAVAATGFEGGPVVHHGPENQFRKSPGVDYLNTAFEPDGDIITLREGPPGQPDLFAKQYFARKQTEGWHMQPNPVWGWGAIDEKTGMYPPHNSGARLSPISDDGDEKGE